MRYRYIDHTSDLGLEIFGRDLLELFRNACFALFDNILHLNAVQSRESKTVKLKSTSLEELFLDWTRELLFQFSTHYFVAREVSQLAIRESAGPGEWELEAMLMGEKFDPARHRIKIEIKTPTYHMFSIRHHDEGYQATVIFDV